MKFDKTFSRPSGRVRSQGAETELERLSGSVERVTFHSEETGFSVLRVKVRGRRELATVVGSSAAVQPGEHIECLGEWLNDKTHGQQFKAAVIKNVPPTSLDGIEKYLGSGLVKGIGPHFAKTLVKAFGERVFEIIDTRPGLLKELPGIGEKRVERITSAWAEQKVVREIMTFLVSHGVGTSRAYRIFKTYGPEAIVRVTENPYRLALDIDGIGFKTADVIAGRLGIDRQSLVRAQAGVRHVLQEKASDGHCALPRERLQSLSAELLEISPDIIGQALDAEVAEENLVEETVGGVPCLFLAALHRAELGVAASLSRILEGQPPWGGVDLDRAIPWAEGEARITLAPSQRDAVRLALTRKAVIITGGPGVGKTTIVNSILKIVRAKGISVALCAPTGRAAKRIEETTGLEAKTIHRALEFDPKAGGFKRGRENPLEAGLVVVDEASMIDIALANRLFAAVADDSALLVVGDVDQLPSVGPGSVLSDLIDSGAVPTVRLTEIHRQAAHSRIIANAHRINQGFLPEKHEGEGLSDFYFVAADTPEAIHDQLMRIVTERIPERFGLKDLEIQVLTPMVRGGLGTHSLNVELQKALNPEGAPRVTRFGTTFAVGDRVIQTTNNYDKEVMNGAIGIVRAIREDDGTAVIDFDGNPVEYDFNGLDEVQLAYAVTIHKSQGSEFPAVVIPLAMQHYLLLQRRLLYTGVTRGRKLVVVVGQPKALGMAVRNANVERRVTNLAARLAAPKSTDEAGA